MPNNRIIHIVFSRTVVIVSKGHEEEIHSPENNHVCSYAKVWEVPYCQVPLLQRSAFPLTCISIAEGNMHRHGLNWVLINFRTFNWVGQARTLMSRKPLKSLAVIVIYAHTCPDVCLPNVLPCIEPHNDHRGKGWCFHPFHFNLARALQRLCKFSHLPVHDRRVGLLAAKILIH